MVLSCCIKGCKEIFIKGGPVTFHKFPKNEARKELWETEIRKISLINFKASDHVKICSKHFKEECFDKQKFGGTWLKPDAKPTIFPNSVENRQPLMEIQLYEENQSSGLTCEAGPSGITSMNAEANLCLEDGTKQTPGRLKRKAYIGDFEKKDMESPSKAAKIFEVARVQSSFYKRKMKTLREKARRLKKKVATLSDIITELKKKNYISDSASAVLKLSATAKAEEFVKRIAKGKSREKYPDELKAFAMTLNFYSAKAYNYVRKTFGCNLPHPSTLRKWYQAIDGAPGFTSEALSALSIKVNEAAMKNGSVNCALIIDEMSIRKHIEWDGTKFLGYVDFGTNLDDDELPPAKEALTLMLNSINGNWKVPIGYFLINGLSSEEKGNLIKEALRLVHETGVNVVSITCDGTSTNIAMLNFLGANLNPQNLIHYFNHPVSDKHVFIILDPSHMLKLVRNALASKGSMVDEFGNLIKWDYITELEKIQKTEGLHLGTKIGTRHVQWYREKMKVKLAAQTFSYSVADALAYLAYDLQLPQFEDCGATINFIRKINDLFDVLNSRNLLSKGFKSPIKQENINIYSAFFEETESYIRGLKTSKNGDTILQSNRKTGFLGFIICMKSFRSLYENLCNYSDSKMKFLLTYKFSQDHLEMFFSAIRSKGGYNNNPTAKQFKSAYVRLLAHHEIMTSDSANCLTLDNTSILNITSSKNIFIKCINESFKNLSEVEELDSAVAVMHDHDYGTSVNLEKLTCYINDVVEYIAGFVVKKLKFSIECVDCCSALILTPGKNRGRLLSRKNRGGLTSPSDAVLTVCKSGERSFRIAQSAKKLASKNIMHLLIVYATRELTEANIFSELKDHSLNQAPLENHINVLIKAILFEYYKIRLYHAGKLVTEALQKDKIRNFNLKTTLFKGQ